MKCVAPVVMALMLFVTITSTTRAADPAGGPAKAGVDASIFDAPPLPKDDQEKKVLDALEAMRKGPRHLNVPAADGRLLRLLTEAVNAKRPPHRRHGGRRR